MAASNSLVSGFCVEALEAAIARYGGPETFTDPCCQFINAEFIACSPGT